MSIKRFPVISNPTDDEMKEFQKRLDAYYLEQTKGEFNSPEIEISLVLKDDKGNIVGGVITSSLLWVMHLEVLWVDKKYRGFGYGRDLVLEAERIGKKNGCKTASTWTFSWQAPEFYQNIGYNIIGIYDGYTDGITEHVLIKQLDIIDGAAPEEINSTRFTISEDPTEESQNILRKGLGKYMEEQVGELRKENPEIKIKLVVKKDDGQVVGGILDGTTLRTMYINNNLWVDDRYRGQGYGTDLLMHAEKLAKKNGCIAAQIYCFSFQGLDFLKKHGYHVFGVSDGYPDGIKEHYLIKKF